MSLLRPRARAASAAIRRLRAAAAALLLTGCADLPTTPTPDLPRQATGVVAPTIDIWWPSEGSWLTGTHPFKALLAGVPLDQYTMYWKVDAGAPVKMWNSYTDYPHKEATVSVRTWSWNGTGPYRITFIAKDRSGRTLAERSTTIFVGTPPALPSGNPLAGATLWVDPWSNARMQADAWRATRPDDADAMQRIAQRAQADWFGDWSGNVQNAVKERTSTIVAAGALPIFVAYNIPVRDCNSYSAGGATSADAYRAWIRSFAMGIETRSAVVVLEPDALGLLDCLPAAEQQLRLDLLRDAVLVLKSYRRIAVYIDAGNAHWQPVEVMAERLRAAGIDYADGFALNVSNYHTTADNVEYGERLSAAVGGKHFVVDTSRNGLGPTEDYEWCNPEGRALGQPPTTSTGRALVDAYLWIKRPGESDGTCNAGPGAGAWWAEYALGLAQRMPTTLAMLP